ncbi:MAG: hypothetical protein P8J27_12500 [Mariniblastus sp.]|nr:hypothetical protein [Mariniblastus sp.]
MRINDPRLNKLIQSLFWALLVSTALTIKAQAQQVRVVATKSVTGTIVATKPGEITLRHDDDNQIATHKIQDKSERAVSINGRPVSIPAKISVSGSIPATLAERGMVLKFTGRANLYGKCDGEVASFEVITGDASDELKVDFLERPEKNSIPAKCEVIGRVVNLSGKTLQLQVPKGKWAKRERINFKIGDNSVLNVTDDHLKRIRPNDQVTRAVVVELSTGDTVIREINIALTAERSELTTSFNEKLEQRFSDLSDAPGKPRDLRSDHFILYTDLSDRSANVLLAKLETMFNLVSGYYSARPNAPIEVYVVSNFNLWPRDQFEPTAVNKIMEPAGVTISKTNRQSGFTKAIVYSCDNHSIVQHESVHAFCAQTFGSTGPVWYSEGMAEMGQYWKPGELAVNIDSVVITYLTSAKPKKMADIIAAGQITGDSWQAYAWRWALCHLLASNPNYSRRFKKLGMNLMAGKPDSFEAAYGKVADKISFEYDQFVRNFGNGYRVDLCAWEWKKCANISSDNNLKQVVKADHGWQATKLKVREGVSYDAATKGNWKITAGGNEMTARGDDQGRGKLIGVILTGFELGEPFDLGTRGSFVAKTEGQLYVRCRDEWTGLEDNSGEVTMYLRRTPKEN